MPFPTYDIVTEISGDLDVGRLTAEISSLAITSATFQGVASDGSTCTVFFDAQPSPVEVTSIDTTVASHAGSDILEDAKIQKMKEIDANTGRLITAGVAYNGVLFSTSANGQANIRDAEKEKDALTYPLPWSSMDNMHIYQFSDSLDVHSLYEVVKVHKLTQLGMGNALKAQVLAATTVAEVDAVVDSR